MKIPESIKNLFHRNGESKDAAVIKNPKKIALIVGIIAAALVLVYVIFGIYFQSHFFFRSTVNGVNANAASAAEVKNRLMADADAYSLTIDQEDGIQDRITSEDVGMRLNLSDGQVEKLLDRQNGFAWIGALFHPKNYVSDDIVTLDQDKLSEKIASLPCVTNTDGTIPTENATYEYDSDKGEFVVKDEVYGTQLDVDEFTTRVDKALRTFTKKLDLVSDKCYVQPTVKSDSKKLASLIDEMNKRLDMKIVYTVGSTKDPVPADEIASWLSADDNLQLTLNTDAMSDYISEMGKQYNTFGKNKQLKTSYGQEVTVVGGAYGWKIDPSGELEQLSEDVLAGKDVSRDFVYRYTAASHDGNDYGNSYVEINLTAQHLFLYVDGKKVLETDFVSGNPNKGNATPTGAYGITYKEEHATLNGENYSTPVNYWMPFNGNVGMHDATWRSKFGGSIYKTNGSHGCVNLPLSAAKTIFGYVSKGFPVLVYTMGGTENTSLDPNAVNAVINQINSIGAVTAASETAIKAAEEAYAALSDVSKAAVTNYATLQAAEASLSAIKSQDQANAGAVINLINAIGTVTTDSGAAIEQAEAAYNTLSDNAKTQVTNFQVLVDARNQYNTLIAQQTPAQ